MKTGTWAMALTSPASKMVYRYIGWKNYYNIYRYVITVRGSGAIEKYEVGYDN